MSDQNYAARFEAARLIRRYGLTEPDQIVLADIAYDLGVKVKTGATSGAEAWLFRKGNKGIIRVRDDIREGGRRRFAIAHELGHWQCHSSRSQFWVCSSQNMQAYWASREESEANTFAAELLMPKAMLCPRLEGKQLSVRLFCDLAQEFDTTLTATAIRVVEEVKEDCCVIFSSNNVVQWHRKSSTGFHFYLPSKFSLHEDSFAADCGRSPSRTIGPKPVPAEAWNIKQRGTEVWEESVLLGDYGTTLTLLNFC